MIVDRMEIASSKYEVGTRKNGVVTPLYFDRQVVRASDLTLEQESRDAALARMRRLVHGHGIVSGFIPQQLEQDDWELSPGYAVTPSGAEVFLAKTVDLHSMKKQLMEACGPTEPGCELLTEEDQKSAMAKFNMANRLVAAWLIARPVTEVADERPSVPQGCAHQGNVMLPSRACHGVRFELCCTLPNSHLIGPANCADAIRYVCANPKTGLVDFVPFPPRPHSDGDFVVIGRFNIDREFGVLFRPEHRRTLLPTDILQDWMQSCLCPWFSEPRKPADATPRDNAPVDDMPDVVVAEDDGRETGVLIADVGVLKERERWWPRDHDFGVHLSGDGVTDPPPEDILILERERERIKNFGDLGITGPDDFLIRDADELAGMTGLPVADILKIKEEVIIHELAETGGDVALGGTWADFGNSMENAGVTTGWVATEENAASVDAPLVTTSTTPATLEDVGIDSPAALVRTPTAALSEKLGVSIGEAEAIKNDVLLNAPIMGNMPTLVRP